MILKNKSKNEILSFNGNYGYFIYEDGVKDPYKINCIKENNKIKMIRVY